jgi:ectoine hydroxylase-related dioxygenase (phytanoyl-CoA dioxygenase family)
MTTNGNKSSDILADQGHSRLFKPSTPPSLDAFKALCSQKATKEDYPLATDINKNVPIYNLAKYPALTEDQRSALQDEWYRILLHGPGVFVTSGLYTDLNVIDKSTAAFNSIIANEKQGTKTAGDHFASAGKNDRIWNSFSKHALQDPSSFFNYYSNPYLDLIFASWLGPGYRITTQVNNVRPGGQPQVSHRDYHLGFMSAETCGRYPRAMQVASQCLTLQGAVAHVDVPLESGPTRLLPFSQAFAAGYMAYRLPEFNEFFLENYISLPLQKGDGLWFNPALFHAAGENKSVDIDRLVNLVQISSAFGKPMETIDALPLVESTWDVLTAAYKEQGLSDEVKMFISAVGEGYPFPTNLDNNPPRNENMAPDSEQDVIRDGLVGGKSKAQVLADLKDFRNKIRA